MFVRAAFFNAGKVFLFGAGLVVSAAYSAPWNQLQLERINKISAACQNWSFSFISDTHSTQFLGRSDKIFARGLRMMSQDRFAVHGGDLTIRASLPGLQTAVRILQSEAKVPVVTTPGNHDVALPSAAVFWSEQIASSGSSEWVEDFSYCGLRFVAVPAHDKAHGVFPRSLEQIQTIKKADVVFQHLPPKSKAWWGFENSGYRRWLEGSKPQLLLAGHIHYFKEGIFAASGVPMVISGGGGGFLLRPWDGHHFVRVRVSNGKISGVEKIDIPNTEYQPFASPSPSFWDNHWAL